MSIFGYSFKEFKKPPHFSSFISLQINTWNKKLNKKEIFKDLAQKSIQLGGDSYLSDGLFTWGRVIGWFRDKHFLDSCNSADVGGDNYTNAAIAWRTHIACWAATQALSTEGDFFEFGCYEGYSAAVIRSFIGEKFTKHFPREYHWFDLFDEGQGGADKTVKLDQSISEKYSLIRASKFEDVSVIKGDIIRTYVKDKKFNSKKIAFAHFDLNDADIELEVIQKACSCATRGTVFLLDDFAMSPFVRQNKIYRSFFRKMGLEILELPTGQGLLIF